MNDCHLIQRNALVVCHETGSGFGWIPDRKEPVICPKPRRIRITSSNPKRPLRWQLSDQVEGCDSGAGPEFLDLILRKDGYGIEQIESLIALSPLIFCGSPPSRANNPLIQEARFGDERISLLLTQSISSPSGASSPRSAHRGGCARMNFGPKPATVRMEGFDGLNRDRRSSSIPAFA